MQLIDYSIDRFQESVLGKQDISYDIIFKPKNNFRFSGHIGCYLNANNICKICIYYNNDSFHFEMSEFADNKCFDIVNDIVFTENITKYTVKNV